ncbi:MAG: organic solvent resistance ABC transporter ATP-binding protein [Acidobacteria bacterium]|nr:MAG: organic solvent resistance ABC transporter ATP-binding protein [Acidobacteriota bacterium]
MFDDNKIEDTIKIEPFWEIVPAIEFQDVCLAYDDKIVLDHIDLSVRRGECKIILGRSGGGKSTIIRLILGLLKPDSGRVLVDGEDITDYTEVEMMPIRQKIGMVFQEGALFDSISVYENVAYRLREQERDEAEIDREVRRMLEFVDLADAVDKMPIELSGGMRRRVGIARALIGDPSIVLFDEPTAGLDPPTARTMCELAIKLRDLQDVSSIFVTHEMNNVTNLCSEYATVSEKGEVHFEKEGDKLCLINTEVLMMRNGQIIFNGTDEQLQASDNQYVKRFIKGER